eukprot:s90_g24.t1
MTQIALEPGNPNSALAEELLEQLAPGVLGEEIRQLRKELRQAKGGHQRKKPMLAPADAMQRTWRSDAADAVRVDGFLSALNLECHGKSLTLADAQAKGEDHRCQLGYMDYCGDGFNAMCGTSGPSPPQPLSPSTTRVADRTLWGSSRAQGCGPMCLAFNGVES